jgi:hypothetical protein
MTSNIYPGAGNTERKARRAEFFWRRASLTFYEGQPLTD